MTRSQGRSHIFKLSGTTVVCVTTMPQSEYKTHTNKEPIRQCPYCSSDDPWEGPGRGLTFHVLNSSDEAHAKKYDTPDGFKATDATVIGYGDVSVEMPEKYDVERRQRFVCDYCGRVCRGEAGLKVHLAHLDGDEAHPDDATDREIDSFPSFDVNENGDLVTQDDESLEVATGGAVPSLRKADTIPVEELEELRDAFLREEQQLQTLSPTDAAERVQDLLERYGDEQASA